MAYSANQQLPASISGPIQQSINNVQAGINSLKASPTFNVDSPATVANNITKSIGSSSNPGGNPLDAPGAVPVAQPGKNLDGTPIGNVASPNPTTGTTANASQPSPQNPQAPQATQANTPTTPTSTGTTDASGNPSFSSFNDQLKQKYGQVANFLNKSGVESPSSMGSASAGVNTALSNIPQPQQKPETPPAVQALFGGDNENIQTQVQALQDIISPPAQKQALQDALDSLKTDKADLANLKVEQMNIRHIMAGTAQDIEDEVTKAGGTITQSLLSNMTIARNKALVAQSTQLDEQIQMATDTVNTDTTLVSDEKQMAAQEAQQRMGLLTFMQTNYNNQMNASRDMYKTLLSDSPEALYNSLVANPVQAQRFQSITGLDINVVKGAVSAKQLDNQKTALEIQGLTLDNAKKSADLRGGGSSAISVNTGNGQTINVSPNVVPYLNTSNSGVNYVDASALEGTAADKTKIIQEATTEGLKVITNKNTAADLVNIKDAYGKLETIQNTIGAIAQPGPVQRALYGAGGTKLSTFLQTDSQKAAAGALQSVGLDILKAISGVQGFRGNQTAIQQVTEHLPSIYDTKGVVSQKLDYIRQLISDREDAALGTKGTQTNTPKLLQSSEIPAGYYQASDGLLYPKQ